ncbi:tetratricopeptide repeat protein [Spirulina subsalsa FACHB-351]|uniref:Tetratricopeptide repeat protein n=1 Tax=Spirulina subsalsa FACHB-351 TaxID=234711 RepID=A0ABT3L0E3_9CYAN|nr:tetratricopeptide repeat protein [Spirulina subsalsa]MCW6034973.1 tetratricopeptide repeat protein [Spirulina subsalsa FACHB-351]
MDLLTQRQQRLTTATAILAGGAVCGGIFGTIATSVAGGIVANDMIPQHLSHIGVRLRRSGEKLANHDLTAATGFAIALIIKAIAEAGTYPQSIGKLTALAKNTLKAWEEVAQALKQGEEVKFDLIQETGISELFQQGTAGYVNQKVLQVEDWRELMQDWLCPKAGVTFPEYVLEEVATQLRDKFALALREVLKADFEAGGKAFAGLTLSLLGEMREVLAELRQSSPEAVSGELAEALEAVVQLRRELEGNSERFRELGQQVDSGFAAVLDELGVTQAQIAGVRDWLEGELESLQEAVIAGFDRVNEDNQRLQETVEGVKEDTQAILRFLKAQQQPKVQAISYFLDITPPNVTHWQGREQDLAIVNGWLDDENTKLGVIVAIGGMGKSTLAAKVFGERTDFVDKLWLDLGQRPSYTIVARGILQHLGKLSPQDLEQIEETRLTRVVIHCLAQQRFLLVLDNFESVIQDEGYVEFLQQWVGECRHTEILVTTQEVPRLQQVRPTEWPLGGLSLQEGKNLLVALGMGGSEASLEGFVAQVNGHPLTLALVAGLLRDEVGEGGTIEDLEGLGLADVGSLLGSLQGYHRRETVQLVAVLDASFNRLSEGLQGVLLSLVVLRRGFDAEVASAIVGEVVTGKVLRDLMKRGFLVEEQRGFFTFQPFIGEYLKFKVGDLREAHLRAIAFYRGRFKSGGEWETVEDVREYLEVFYHRCELGEYEAAFDGIYDGRNIDRDVDKFLDLRGNNQLRVELYQQLVNHLPDHHDWRYTASLTSLGNAYNALGRYQEAIAFLQQSLDIAREIGNRGGEANSLGNLGNAYNSLGRYQEAIAFLQQSLEIKREIGDRQGEANSLGNLGNAYNALGRYEEAIAFLQQSLEIKREIEDRRGEATSLLVLGNLYQKTGKIKEGFAASQQAQAILQELDLPLAAYPIPNWAKAVAKFAQRSNFHLIACFIGGIFAFPFFLLWIILLMLYRIIRNLFPHP